jgi:hypothetical protein
MDVAELVELEAIKGLKHRYLRCLDQKRWDDLAECFTPDATAAYGGGKYSYDGRDAIMTFLRTSLGPTMITHHHCAQPEIEFTSPTRATGRWSLHDTVLETAHNITISGAAFYDDVYVKVEGDWKIAHTGYERLFELLQDRGKLDGLQITELWAPPAP